MIEISSVRGCGFSRLWWKRTVAFRTPIAEKLPNFANFRNHVEIEIGYNNFIFIPAGLRDNFPARIAEIALSIELTNVPRFFDADTVDGAHKITVRNGMRRLLEFPQIFGE